MSGIRAFIAVTLASFHLGDQNGEGGVLPLFIPEKSIPLGNIVILVPNLVCDVVYYHVINYRGWTFDAEEIIPLKWSLKSSILVWTLYQSLMNCFKCQMTSDDKTKPRLRLDWNFDDPESLYLASLQTKIEWALLLIFGFYQCILDFFHICSGFDFTNMMTSAEQRTITLHGSYCYITNVLCTTYFLENVYQSLSQRALRYSPLSPLLSAQLQESCKPGRQKLFLIDITFFMHYFLKYICSIP